MLKFLREIRQTLPPAYKYAAAGLAAMMVVSALLELAALALVMPVASALAAPELLESNRWLRAFCDLVKPSSREAFLLQSVAVLTLFFIVKNVFGFVLTKCQNRFCRDLSVNLAGRLYRTYMRADYTFHLEHGASELIGRIMQMREVAEILLMPALVALSESVVFLSILAVVFVLVPKIALVAFLVCGTVVLVFHKLFRRVLDAASKKLFAANGESTRTMNQSFAAIREVKLTGTEAYFGRRLEQAQFNIVNAVRIRHDLGQIPRFSLEVFVVAAAGALVAVLTWMGMPSSRLILYAAFFLAAMFRLIPSVSRMQYNLILVRGMLYVFERLAADLNTIPAEKVLPEAGASDVHFERELAMEHVTFRYAPDRPVVFEDFSMSVKRLECVAVVGPTGSGKSTLIDLVMGFLKPESGRVTADGADIRTNLRSWRGRIGYVPQSICLFDDTIRANVAFGVEPDKIDDARVKKALELAQIADFVESLPDKLNTRLGEFGARISGGQKQRIAIARALYSEPELLILDEATSALDDDTEAALIDALNSLKGKLTILMIAHRAGSIRHCDRKIELN
ncbi:MAG: ATP-binding cassette domain-containing protein [Lentisphaeria bacterium]|nr:ATP-binding cassette domain-containing protein [Lentisphaeria bacterium]